MAPNETPRRKPLLVALAAKAPAIAPVMAPAAIEKHNPWEVANKNTPQSNT